MKKGRLIFILIIILAAAGFVSFSPKFERSAPIIALPAQMFWNARSPIEVRVSDESQLKKIVISYRKEGDEEWTRLQQIDPQSNEELLKITGIKTPRMGFGQPQRAYELRIEATDSSLWQWGMGNATAAISRLEIDSRAPSVNVLANSYAIARGGAALVVFFAEDENLQNIYIQSGSHKFSPTPFIKDGYFISLLAWDVLDDAFSADIIATDAAGNITRAHVPLYHKDQRYKSSEITASEAFVQGKIKDLFERYAEPGESTQDGALMLDFVNAKLRQNNEKLIHQITKKVSSAMISDFTLQPFLPLKNGAKVANFADHRYYLYKGQRASESWHMGIDLASVKMAPIVLSNPGRLVFAQENGIYGLNLLVDHGLGLFSLYGHCSTAMAQEGEELGAGSVIARTGTSGLALGDHLHFGMLVQGVEVRPEEWLDKKWLNDNIFAVIKKAKTSIK